MKQAKKFLSLVLAVLMLVSIVPMTDLSIEASAASVDQAMSWCEGKVGSKVGTGQCVALIQAYYKYLGVSAVSGNACDYATNSVPSGWSRVKGGTPQKGDILVYTGAKYGHVAIYAGGTTSYHQNMSGLYVEKKTNWAYNKSWYSNAEGGTKSYWGYIRPSFGGSSPSSHTRNTNYGTNFSATANEKIDVFNADHSDPGNYYIDKGDKCTIHEVYTDGCCYVTYPISGGTRTYYAPISKFTIGGSNPIGAVDSVWAGEGFVHVSGWAFDADSTSTALSIHVYIGDEGHGWIIADKERVDVNNVHGCGNYHGYGEDIQTSKTGTQTVSIYAINVAGGSNVLLHSTTVNIKAVPTYKLDVNAVVNGSLYESGVAGYTFDMYLDGSLVSNDVKDFCETVKSGTKYEIKNIKCPSGYKFTSGTTSGTVSGNIDIRLSFSCTHSSTEVRNAKSATCTATGYTGDTYCKTCGTKTKTGSTIAKTSHNSNTTIPAVAATCTATGLTEGKKCSVCGTVTVAQQTVAKKAHSYTSSVTTQPTCTKEGVRTYKCSCGASYTETISKTSHNSNAIIPAVAATCTKTGLTEGKKCSVCGTVTVAQQTVAKKAHSYTSSVTTQPTCTKEGVRTYKCSCGDSYTEKIAKKAHTIVTDKAVSATCTKTGLTEGKHCSVCNTVTVAQKTVATVSHIDNNSDYKCDYNCGYEFDKPADPTPSTPDTPSDPADDCSCNCHKGGIAGFFFKIINFFQKLFGMNKVCACGVKH